MNTVVSLFAGIGGLDSGFEQAGFEIIWANEKSSNASRSYERHFGREVACGDINEISLDKIPSARVIIGGPPCQAFSLVGKRRSDDERGLLVFRFAEIIERGRPAAFVMENVPGLAASKINGARMTDHLCEAFRRMGYEVSLMKLMATDYFVPQRRKRLFIVGCRAAEIRVPDPAVFCREHLRIDPREFDLSAKAAIGDLGPSVEKGALAHYCRPAHGAMARLLRGPSKTQVSMHESPRMSETDSRLVQHVKPGGNYQDIPDEAATGRILKFKKTGGRTTTYGRLHPDRPAYTINTYFRRPNVGCHFHYSQDRLITAREAMRFQSLPDSLELFYGAQDERNAFIGNAVPPLLARAVAWSVKCALGD